MKFRELKFRVWSNLMQKFAVDTEFSHILYQSEDFSEGTFTVGGDNCEIQQFTGLLDKNGKEIYEGDLVELDNDNDKENIDRYINKYWEVRWQDNFCCFMLFKSGATQGANGWWDVLSCSKRGKIVGNIFENK